MNRYIRKDLESFKPYHAPLKPYEIKIDANENPFEHHPGFPQYMYKFISNKDHVTRYPDTDAHELREKIADHYNVDKDNVICGVGSDQVIESIIKVFLNPNDTVIVPTPSFSMYKLTTIVNHGQVIEVPLNDDFEYDLDLFIETIIKVKPKLVFLCTPNNPTGCVLTKEEILKVVKISDCPVVVDEAYAEFTGISVIDQINNYDNLIVLRTFSKIYGLAGFRTGYALANKDMIDTINIARSPYNLSSFSQAASIFVLKHHDYYMKQVDILNSERERLARELKTFPCIERVYKSHVNFLLVKMNVTHIAKLLEENFILVRDYPPTGDLANCIRFSIGTEEENERLLNVLKEVVNG